MKRCQWCDGRLKEYLNKLGLTGVLGCEHCDRPCLVGQGLCRRCERVFRTKQT